MSISLAGPQAAAFGICSNCSNKETEFASLWTRILPCCVRSWCQQRWVEHRFQEFPQLLVGDRKWSGLKRKHKRYASQFTIAQEFRRGSDSNAFCFYVNLKHKICLCFHHVAVNIWPSGTFDSFFIFHLFRSLRYLKIIYIIPERMAELHDFLESLLQHHLQCQSIFGKRMLVLCLFILSFRSVGFAASRNFLYQRQTPSSASSA